MNGVPKQILVFLGFWVLPFVEADLGCMQLGGGEYSNGTSQELVQEFIFDQFRCL